MRVKWAAAAALLPLLSACDGGMVEVSDPFYLGNFESGGDPWLFRCTQGAGRGCANDTLPDGRILRAGGNAGYIAFQMDAGIFYFRRIPQEKRGWGQNPEAVVGPLDAAGYAATARELGLPAMDVEW